MMRRLSSLVLMLVALALLVAASPAQAIGVLCPGRTCAERALDSASDSVVWE